MYNSREALGTWNSGVESFGNDSNCPESDPSDLSIRAAVEQIEDVTDCLWSYKTALSLTTQANNLPLVEQLGDLPLATYTDDNVFGFPKETVVLDGKKETIIPGGVLPKYLYFKILLKA
jgi:hypothetical protein